jgi:hypothetical protein
MRASRRGVRLTGRVPETGRRGEFPDRCGIMLASAGIPVQPDRSTHPRPGRAFPQRIDELDIVAMVSHGRGHAPRLPSPAGQPPDPPYPH